MKDRVIYDCIEDIANAWYCEIVAGDASDNIKDILEDELCADLDRVLAKIKFYAHKLNN